MNMILDPKYEKIIKNIDKIMELLPDNLPLNWNNLSKLDYLPKLDLLLNFDVSKKYAVFPTYDKCDKLLHMVAPYNYNQINTVKFLFISLPKKYVIYDLFIRLVKIDYEMLEYVPKHYMTKKMCLKSLNTFKRNYSNFIPDNFMSKKFCSKAFDISESYFVYIPNNCKTKRMCIKIAKNDILDFNYVPTHLLTNKVLKTFFKHSDINKIFYYIDHNMALTLKTDPKILILMIKYIKPRYFFGKINNIKLISNLSDDDVIFMINQKPNIFSNIERHYMDNYREYYTNNYNCNENNLINNNIKFVMELIARINILLQNINSCILK